MVQISSRHNPQIERARELVWHYRRKPARFIYAQIATKSAAQRNDEMCQELYGLSPYLIGQVMWRL
jgi:hypothetical protein